MQEVVTEAEEKENEAQNKRKAAQNQKAKRIVAPFLLFEQPRFFAFFLWRESPRRKNVETAGRAIFSHRLFDDAVVSGVELTVDELLDLIIGFGGFVLEDVDDERLDGLAEIV